MGNSAIPFKITNIGLHLLCTALVYGIFANLAFSKLTSILGTAIFAFHPIHITSIHFILGRTDLVAAVFYFAAIYLVAKWKNTISVREYIAVTLCFIAALLSKEMSVTLPVMMLVIFFSKQHIKNTQSFIKTAIILSPFFAITLMYLVIRIYMWSKLNTLDVYTNYSATHLVSNYLNWLFALGYPFDLYVAQDAMIENPIVFFSAVAIVGLVTLAGLLFFLYKKPTFRLHQNFWLWMALLWIVITLLPISGGHPHRWYLYIPSFGLSLLVASLIDTNKQKIVLAIGMLLIVLYCIEDLRLSSIWKKQSEVTIEFLRQIEASQIHKKDRIYFANIPFGYKSAYLFTHSSLQEAIQYHVGKSPTIVALSYLNMNDQMEISTSINENNIQFKMTPNHYKFFLLSASERRFDRPYELNKENVTIKINAIAGNKKISDYTISISDSIKPDFYYFDGKRIKSIISN